MSFYIINDSLIFDHNNYPNISIFNIILIEFICVQIPFYIW